MKINFLISSLSGGGAEKVVTILSKQFAENGHDGTVLSLEEKPQFYDVDEKVGLIRYENKYRGSKKIFKQYSAVKKFIRENTEGINISFLSRCNLLSAVSNIFKKRKLIVCDRNNPLREHSRLSFKISCLLYRQATAIVVQTEKIKSFYPKYLQKKIFVIENPIDKQALEAQLGDLPADKEKTIVSVGRLEKQKDFFTLINAFSLVEKDYPEYKLKIFGKGSLEKELKDHILSLGLDEKVLLCGSTNKPFYQLKKSEVFVLSSEYEGFPNALCEAMYAGLACISSDCVSGPGELIEDGENGFLFEVGNTGMLAEKLRTVLDDERLRAELGERAKTSVERLSVDKIFSKWKEITEQLLYN